MADSNSTLFRNLVIALGVGYLLFLLAPILTPFLLSLLFAYIGNPLVTRAQLLGIPRTVTIMLLFFIFTLTVLGLVLGIVPLVQKQIIVFSDKLPGYVDWLQAQVANWTGGTLTVDLQTIKTELAQRWQDVGKWLGTVLTFATDSGMRVVNWLLNLFLIPIVTFYLLRDWDEVMHGARKLLPPAQRTRFVPFAREADDALSGFLRGQLSVMLALAVIYSVGLWIVGLELALPIGLFAGLVSFVPYLGFIVGIVFAEIAALFQFQEWLPMVWVAVAFMVGQVLESTVLTPRFVGERIGMHPVVVIFTVMAGGQLFGFFGILLALPVAAIFMVWLRHIQSGYKKAAAKAASKPAP